MLNMYGLIGELENGTIRTLYFGGLTFKYSGDKKYGCVVFSVPREEIGNPNYVVDKVYSSTYIEVCTAQQNLDAMCEKYDLGVPVVLSDPFDLEEEVFTGNSVYDIKELNSKLALDKDVDWIETTLPSWAYSQYVYVGEGYIVDCGKYPYKKSTEGKNVSELVLENSK